MIKAIETVYSGYRFRSRLEARWAVFFDEAGIKYEYEPDGFDLDGTWYLPDFYLSEQDCFIEIKGQTPTSDELRKAELLAIKSKKNVYIFFGSIPNPKDLPQKLQEYEGDNAYATFLCFEPEDDEPAILGRVLGCIWSECESCRSIRIRKYHTVIAEWCCEDDPGSLCNSPRLTAAYTAARQARFEHGETPSLISPMTPYKILQMASNLGLHLSVVEGNNVRVVGPKKNITEALCDYIRQYKLEIIELLNKGKVGKDDCNI